MGTAYDSVNVRCPFYCGEKKGCLTCEGFIDGCSLSIKFDDAKDMRTHKILFCDSSYENCEVHKMIIESKY